MPDSEITGFVLAGGQSQRMKKDKARISWADGTLLSHACDRMQQITSKVFVVGGVQKAGESIAWLEDKFLGRGPLAGIYSALRHTNTDWNLVLAIDLPLVSAGVLQFVAGICRSADTSVVAIRVGGRLQSLCAAYHRELVRDLEPRLQSGDLSIHRLLQSASTRIIEEEEFLAAGFSSEMFLNVNTPEDLERARALAKNLHV